MGKYRLVPVVLTVITSLAAMTAIPASASTTISGTAHTTTQTVTCTGGGSRVERANGYCDTCGNLYLWQEDTYCTKCSARIVTHAENSNNCPHSTFSVLFSVTLPHGTISQTSTDYYYNNAYAYRGNYSTCRAYTLDITQPAGVSASINSVRNSTYNMTATVTNYIVGGNYVTISLSNSTSATLQVSLNGATPVAVTGSTYSFTMPYKDSTLAVTLMQQAQTINVATSVTKTYNSPRFNLGATVT